MPFKVVAGARTSSLVVASTGKIGFGTATPAVDLHDVVGNTPTLRLEQDGSSGWTPQVWDVAGNETNFFIRDVTHSSNLPFRIFPGSSTDTLRLNASGYVEIGKPGASPTRLLDVNSNTASQLRLIGTTDNRRIVARQSTTGSADTQIVMKSASILFAGPTDASDTWAAASSPSSGVGLFDVYGSTASQFRLVGNTENRRIVARDSTSGSADTQIVMKNSSIVFAGATDASNTWATISAAGIVTNIGSCTSASPCDAVFDPAVYKVPSIDDHAKAMWGEGYLPAVGPTQQGQQINVTEKMTRMLAELEQAHIYIAELNDRVKTLEAKVETAAN